jgi:hypothetical protein
MELADKNFPTDTNSFHLRLITLPISFRERVAIRRLTPACTANVRAYALPGIQFAQVQPIAKRGITGSRRRRRILACMIRVIRNRCSRSERNSDC